MKKRYLIHYTGIMEQGYVTFRWLSLNMKFKTVPLASPYDSYRVATRFRFKWFADWLCRSYNNWSARELALKTFTVVEDEIKIDLPKEFPASHSI